MYLRDTMDHGSSVKLSFQLRATPSIALNLLPQFVSLRPCMTPIDEWGEKVYSVDTKSIGTELKKWRTPLKH
jgi:hypothetical protein